MGLYELVKQAASKAQDASMPCAIMFGVVTVASPLTILVENRLPVSGSMIILPRELRAGEYPTHTHTVEEHMHLMLDSETGSGGEPSHTHSIPVKYTEKVPLITEIETETYYGLAVGEQVILLRNSGGQQFLVLGRL